MKYLCLVYIDERLLAGLSRARQDQLAAQTAACEAVLRQRGCYLEGRQLPSVALSTTVRPGSVTSFGKKAPLITDGPYADTTEQLAGYMLVEAPDLDEAIRIAATIPAGALGCIEIRPVCDRSAGP